MGPVKVKIGKLGAWTPSSIAWALGTFSYVLASVFLVRIYYVHRYRHNTEVIYEEVHRAGVLIDRHIQGLLKDVDNWVEKQPSSTTYTRLDKSPAVLGVRAVRVYKKFAVVSEWTDPTTTGERFGIENILIRDPNTRLVSMGRTLMALAWTRKDLSKVVMVFDRDSFNLVFTVSPQLQGQVSLAIVNSMEQIIFQSDDPLPFEVFRSDVQYRYDGQGTVEVQDLGRDLLAFLSIPSVRGAVLIGRVGRR